MLGRIIFVFSMFLVSSLSHAQEIDSTDMLLSLQEDMQEYSEIATRTRQNVEYMPYVISAWDSEELSKMGISTLGEALTLVPGVDISIGTVGTPIPIFRGSNPFAIGQSRLVLDGIVINDKMTGGYNQVMDMPISIIQRIEVVRGPGSLLSYVNGYAGSIHVITKSNRDDGLSADDELFAELGSSQYRTAGFVASHEGDELKVSGDLAYKKNEQTLPVDIDRFGNSGESQQRLDYYSIGLNAGYKNLTVKARLLSREGGASYGQSFSLSEDDSDFTAVDNNIAELIYAAEVSKDIKIDLSVGYIELNRRLQNKVIPDGETINTPGGPVTLINGRYFLNDIKEETSYERVELHVNTFESHSINVGIYASQTDMVKREGQMSDDNMQTFVTFDLLQDIPRDLVSFYIDDLIDLTEKTSIQLGLKYDHYSDVESQHSPRLALVHRYDDKNIYKVMYSSSYREPAWREQYLTQASFFKSTLDLKPEKVDAYELAYIRKIGMNSQFELNAYYLGNHDQINAQNATNTFKNSGDNNLHGLEIEYKYIFHDNDQFYFNYSYVEGGNVGDKLANSAESMVKAYYIYNLDDGLAITGIAKFVDQKDRVETDTRADVASYALFDLSINYQLKPAAIDINLSVKNLLDKTYYLSSPQDTYPNDFEREGRSILFSLRKGF